MKAVTPAAPSSGVLGGSRVAPQGFGGGGQLERYQEIKKGGKSLRSVDYGVIQFPEISVKNMFDSRILFVKTNLYS
jgi:hypothetical protein